MSGAATGADANKQPLCTPLDGWLHSGPLDCAQNRTTSSDRDALHPSAQPGQSMRVTPLELKNVFDLNQLSNLNLIFI